MKKFARSQRSSERAVPAENPPEPASHDLDVSEEWSPRGRNDPPAPHYSAVETNQPSSPRGVRSGNSNERNRTAAGSGHAQVRGVARAIQHRSDGGASVLSFRVERYDRSGNRLPPVPIELRGPQLSGQLSEGEEVAVTGKWRHGTIRAHTIVNITTAAHIRVSSWRNLSPAAKAWWVGSLVFVGLAVAAVIVIMTGLISGPADGSGSTVRVPDLAGMSTPAAIRALNEAGLRWSGDSEESNQFPFGKVVRTDPPAGTDVERGKTILVITSTGRPFR